MKYDEDKSATLSAFELRPAIKSLGWQNNVTFDKFDLRIFLFMFLGASLSKKIISKLVTKYAGLDGDLCFNDFISVAAKVASCLGKGIFFIDPPEISSE